MEKTINGVKYYLPSNLTSEQKAIYIQIINWKRKNITTQKVYIGGMNTMPFYPIKQLFQQ